MHLNSSRKISTSANENYNDIARFVESEVTRLKENGLLLRGNISQGLHRKIVDKLTGGAQGMFRWVSISLETLVPTKHNRDFVEALGKLPPKLASLYDIVHAEIDRSGTYGRDAAVKTMKWLLSAQRLLSAKELLAAIEDVDSDPYSDSDSSRSDGGRAPSREDEVLEVLDLCRNLDVLDSKLNVFRLAHQSVRE